MTDNYQKNMQFDHSYFEDDVLEGFYVPALIKKSWAAQIELLSDIDKVCRKHGITYFAEWGTLLGAVRHGGFIPWDDDLDIAMRRADYMKFLSVAKDELPKEYAFLNYYEADFYEMLTRVVNTTRLPLSAEQIEKFHGFPFNVGIDIFVYDNIAPSKEEQEVHQKLIDYIYSLMNNFESISQKDLLVRLDKLQSLLKFEIKKENVSKRDLCLIADKICMMYDDVETEEISLLPLWVESDLRFPVKYYDILTYLPFENFKMPVPIAYNEALKKKYGSYLNPYRAGGAHEYPVFQRQVKTLEDFLQRQVDVRFELSMDAYYDVQKQRPKSLFKQVNDIVAVIGRLHGEIVQGLSDEEYEKAFALLEQCQQTAITVGNMIEKVNGKSDYIVPSLEAYCELVYDAYSMLSEGNVPDLNELDALFQEHETAMVSATKKELQSKKKVLFMPYEFHRFKTMRHLWEKASQNHDCEVYVVPIPYYEKNADGSLGQMHYEGEMFELDIEIYDYTTFDFGKVRPDIIYFQNPYDEYNAAISVHPFFYAKKLLQMTDKLIYVPGFVPDDFEISEERAVLNLRNYCMVPGVVYADEVILSSEVIKQRYVEMLTKAAGEETKTLWEDKITVDETAKENLCTDVQIEIPKEWEDIIYSLDGTKKKVMVYALTCDTFVQHEGKAIEKIKQSLEIFKSHCEKIALIWRMPNELLETVMQYDSCLGEQLKQLVNEYKEQSWGILDASFTMDWALSAADAYYGDVIEGWKKWKMKKIPMMIESVEG